MTLRETSGRTRSASPTVPVALATAALLLCTAPLGAAAPDDPDDAAAARVAVDDPDDPPGTLSQEEKLRARDLEVLEELLTTSVADAIRTALTGGDESGTWLLQVSGEGWARGMFLEGYGVFFALQLPRLPIVPRFMVEGMADAQRQELQRRLAELEARRARFEAEIATLDTPERRAELRERLRALDHELSELRRRLASRGSVSIDGGAAGRGEVRVEAEQRVAGDAGETEAMQRAGAEQRRADRGRRYATAVTSLPALAMHREEAEERRRAIVTASAEAVIETLGHYARVIHGLEDDDRLAVVLLPDTPQIFWRGAKPTPREEYILTVRYRDVMELDAGSIDLDEFKSRVAVRGRMGQPVDVTSPMAAE